MCLGCGGVGGEWVEGLEEWGGDVCVSSESGLFVYMAGPGICISLPCICLWQISQIQTVPVFSVPSPKRCLNTVFCMLHRGSWTPVRPGM